MKKLLLLIFSLSIVLSLSSCGFNPLKWFKDKNKDDSANRNDNEIILLVDASYSIGAAQQKIESFIDDVIYLNNGTNKLGIVTFGYDQVYACELSYETKDIYLNYLSSKQPNIEATNIADAINYASSLFTNPKKSKIVLISDGLETDGDALEAVKNATSKGITVDTVDFNVSKGIYEAQITDITRPSSKIKFGEQFTLELTVQSTYAGNATISVYENDVPISTLNIKLAGNTQAIKIPITINQPNANNIHKLSFVLESDRDSLKTNNTFHSYILTENFNKILILESIDGESAAIERMLGVDFDITTVNIDDTNRVPSTLDNLRLYDQVILCNVSYGQMPEGFEKILYDYVSEAGGGLFTVCGTEADGETPNAFTKEDLKPSQYLKKLLPVDVINFTPPVAVMLLIDKSGSMYSEDFDTEFETSKLYYALQGARVCLDLLSERDYIGVYELDDYGEEALELTPATERSKILNSIQNIGKDGGGTVFSTALAAAGQILRAQTDVEKKHIIVITDGEPDSSNVDLTKEVLLDNAAAGITTSIIGIQCTNSAQTLMKQLLVEFAGVEEKNFHNVYADDSVPDAVRDDMGAPEITDFNYEEFQIQIGTTSDITKIDVNGKSEHIKQEDMPTLEGFYGMKAKDADGDNNDLTKNLQVLLKGEFTPIYTQWTYGKGKVGTFGCDLNGNWSSGFIDTPEGTAILTNIVNGLMPNENIRYDGIDVEYEGENYETQVNVYTKLSNGEYVEITVTSPSNTLSPYDTTQTFIAGENDCYWKFNFDLTTVGIHEILAAKKNFRGEIIAQKRIYKSISYSKEYDMFPNRDEASNLLLTLSKEGNGKFISNTIEVFEFPDKYLIDKNQDIPYTHNVAILDTRMIRFDNKYTLEVDVVCYGQNRFVTVYAIVEGKKNTEDETEDELDGVIDGLAPTTFEVSASEFLYDGEITTLCIPEFRNDDFSYETEYSKAYESEYPYLFETVSYTTVTARVEEDDPFPDDDNFCLLNTEKLPIKVLYSSNNPNNYFSTAIRVIREKLKYNWDIKFEEFIVVPELENQVIPTEGYDVYIYERYMPDTLPNDGIAIISDPWFDISGSGFKVGSEKHLNELTYFATKTDHPIINDLFPEEIGITKYTEIINPDASYTPILFCGNTPVLYATDKDDENAKVVLMPFSLNYSNLPLIIDFPLMIYNIIEYYMADNAAKYFADQTPSRLENSDSSRYVKANQVVSGEDYYLMSLNNRAYKQQKAERPSDISEYGGSKYEESNQVIDGETYYRDALSGNTEDGVSYYEIARERLERDRFILSPIQLKIAETYINIL